MCFVSAEITPKRSFTASTQSIEKYAFKSTILKADKLAVEAQDSYLDHIIKIYPSILYLPLFMLLLMESMDHIVGSLH